MHTHTLDIGTVLKDRLRPPDRPIAHQGIHKRGYSEVGLGRAHHIVLVGRGYSWACQLDRILSVTLLEHLQIKAPLISEDEPIITYLNTSNISASPTKKELLQPTTPRIGSENEIEDPTPFSLSIEEDCFNDDILNSSKAPTCNLKVLKFEPAGQDQEQFMASKENLLELSAIISRNWSTGVEEDGSYIRIYPDVKAVCCCLQGFSFQTVCYDPRVGLNILLLHEASHIYMEPLMPSTKIL
jgi:hypothetical protein